MPDGFALIHSGTVLVSGQIFIMHANDLFFLAMVSVCTSMYQNIRKRFQFIKRNG